MSEFPLQPFLSALAADGLKTTLRDYERIRLALQTGGTWSMDRLRAVLLALLARDEDQQELFLRRFDEFFDPQSDIETRFADIDIDKVLADLQTLAGEPQVLPTKPPTITQRLVEPVIRPLVVRRRKFLYLAAALVTIVGLCLAIWRLDPFKPTVFAKLRLTPVSLNFGKLKIGAEKTEWVTLANIGSDSLRIARYHVSSQDSSYFLGTENLFYNIAPGDSFILAITFVPRDSGRHTARLEIPNNGKDSPQSFQLMGECIVDTARGPVVTPARQRRYTNVPYVKDVQYQPLARPNEWRKYAGLAVFFLIVALIFSVCVWHSRKIPEAQPAEFDPNGPQHFSPAAIGGPPAPRLDAGTLDLLADSMGYFKSEVASRQLHVPASINATTRNGGIPSLVFHPRKQLRALLILEDVLAQARTWNPIACELADGMGQRGVPVLHGQFNGTPGQFKTGAGLSYRLEDLENQRRGYLVLVFTDGKALDRQTGAFELEALARWPMVAWLDLREQRAWDESSTLPGRFGMPLYPATAAGLVGAIGRFVTETSSSGDFSQAIPDWPDLAELADGSLAAVIEAWLGDAFVWALDCSMIQPIPLSLGLADGLRRKFHPHLPAERIERLLTLPGTWYNDNCLHFSFEVLKELRNGFYNRRSQEEQEAVLQFIADAVIAAQPDQQDTLAHQSWEAMVERLRLEREPDDDCQRLASLAKGPLAGYVASTLENFGAPGQPGKIPLRCLPNNQAGKQRLARIDKNLGIPVLQAFPVAWWQRLVLGILVLAFVVTGIKGLNTYYLGLKSAKSWQVMGPGYILAQLQQREGDTWQILAAGSLDSLTRMALKPDDYRLFLYHQGVRTSKAFGITRDSSSVLPLDSADRALDCRQLFPAIGLEAYRCPDAAEFAGDVIAVKGWRERLGEQAAGNRMLSIGLEIGLAPEGTTRLAPFHNALLQTGSIDVLYRLLPDSAGQWHIKAAMDTIQADLGPLLAQGQLIWWLNTAAVPETSVVKALPPVSRVLKLGDANDPSFQSRLENLLNPGTEMLVREQNILAELATASATGAGEPVLLIRPLTDVGFLVVATRPGTARLTFINLADNSQATGRPGERIELKSGSWRVTAQAAGYDSTEQKVEITAGQEQSMTLSLTSPGDRYLVIAFSADSRAKVVGVLNRLKEKIGSSFDQEFPDVAIYDDPFTEYALVIGANLSHDDALALKERAIRRGFSTDTRAQFLSGDRRGTGSVRVTTRPASASITITSLDSAIRRTGKSGQAFELTTEDWRIQATADGYEPKNSLVTVTEGEEKNVMLQLSRIVAPPDERPGMVKIPGGWFDMGSETGGNDEKPVHRVYISSFYMDTTEVTNAQFCRFLNERGNQTEGGTTWLAIENEYCSIEKQGTKFVPKTGFENHPVVEVNWFGARAYADWDGKRLPTEAEWEYAARGALQGKAYPWGDDITHNHANYSGTGGRDQWEETAPVASFPANGYGLYDMSGNVYEWCADWYDSQYYIECHQQGIVENPQGPAMGSNRVLRGGAWGLNARYCRSAYRSNRGPDSRSSNVGVRLVFVP